jgi:ubiquinone/menaquinone biosynthesis C-methylase UbiE
MVKDFFDVQPEMPLNDGTLQRMDLIKATVEKRRPEMLLDVGCGAGKIGTMIEGYVGKYTGIDLSEERVELAKRRLGNAFLQVASATDLPFPDETFDFVLCSEVLEHVPKYDKAVFEAVRCLKRGGTLLITTPNYHNLTQLLRIWIKKSLKVIGIKKRSKWYDEPVPITKLSALFRQSSMLTLEKGTFFMRLYGYPSLRLFSKVLSMVDRVCPAGVYVYFILEKK